jgi:exopolysaccharide biosynthesis polyprenyl glycosylphosphotransferase
VDEVIYSKNRLNHSKIQEIIKVCEEVGVVFRLQSDLSPMSSSNAYMVNFEGTPFLTFMNTPKNSIALGWKSVTDILLSAAMLLVLSPILLLVSILIKLDSRGPVIFKQARVGLRGRKFYIYKFRTMVQDAEKVKEKLMQQNEMDGPVFKIKRDPRITRIGRFLRKSGLDELPQLYNVVKGEMSLIGPRPPLPEEVKQYERWHLRRLSIKPGITCSWQIIPNRNDVLFENWMKLDLNYIDNWSLRLDFKLLMKTIRTVILGSGA